MMTPASAAFGLLIGTTSKSSSGVPSILIFGVIGAAFYFLIYRPQQRKAKAARAQTSAFDVGDEVVTAGGIVGRILDITDDRVTLETSVGASFVVLRPYILRKLEPAEPPGDVVDGSDEDDESDHEPQPPSAPPAPSGTSATGTPPRDEPSPQPPKKGTPDTQGPTKPPPAEDPDGSDASGADGPPII